ncbi:MAG TPA: 16S rRNA (adenine(1518)-N(6)/adenine(1519)-N(6))-dimethyltransferase RsmA [Candidatus Bathyarchaeia archaeon]|nr:16S rRNA (adenine(1518)-N(6)/adenine(1519)-N(6))-dimethyltransferase RsmA [Candidatus Bathyarchaeia archaeon]
MKANTGCSLGRHNKSLSLYRETLNTLRRHRIFARKRLGQNFTVDDSVLQSLITHADVNANDTVLEVGPGLGTLTRLLASKAKKVITVEIDPKLILVLRRQISHLQNVEVVENDVLKANIPRFDKVVSTPPYSISSPLLFWLLKRPFKLAVLVFQEEFARRLTASVGSKDYSRLTVAVYYRADVELLDHVPKDCFYPPPDVDSTIVRLKPKPTPFRVQDEKAFFEVVRTVFTQRNKKLRNAVVPLIQKRTGTREKAQAIADSLTFHDKRVRELAPEDFGALTNEITEKTRNL